jgi:hypothetical protein
MSRRSLLKLMALAGPAVFAFDSESPEMQSQTLPRTSAPSHSIRPRLFYNTASIERLGHVFAPETVAGISLRQKGEVLLRAEFYPENVAEIGGGQAANYGTPATQVADMGLTLGLLFHLTSDPRYASKLRDALLYYGNYVRWAGPELSHRSPPWHSELDTTTFGFGYSCGYDALHGFLSEADRRIIADTMFRLAVGPTLDDWILPGKRIHSLDSMGHNWWGVCVSGAGLCALALLGDDPRAPSWIAAIDAGYVQWFAYPGNVLQNRARTFEPSGPSYEGVAYTNYGVSEYLQYRFAWQNTFPGLKPAKIEPLEHLAEYFLQTLYPTSSGFLNINFGDGSLESDSSATILLLIACGLGTPAATRYLEFVKSASQSTLFSLLRQFPRPAPQSDPPLSCIYPEMGWAVLRSSWERDATLFAVKSGYTWNHAHADAGSFVLFHRGQPLIIDSGTCTYSRPEYTTYYRTSRAHNVILFNGQGQPSDDISLGCKFPGRTHTLIDGPGLRYLYADATGPMARWFTRNYRHCIWIGDLILIIDDVRAHAPGEMDWLLHFQGESAAGNDGFVNLKNGQAEAAVKMLHPAAAIGTEIGLADHDPDKKIPYLVFHPDGAAQSRQFITVVCLDPSSIPLFDVADDPNYLHVRIQRQNAFEELIVSRRAMSTAGTMCINAAGFTTDAYFIHLQRPASGDPVRQFFVADGSYLRQAGQSQMESLSKQSVCWTADESLRMFSNAGPLPIQIGMAHSPRAVYWNGQKVAATYSHSGKFVSLQ